MSSALQDIANTIATDFREAVMDAEKEDREAIEAISKEFNTACHDYFTRDAVIQSQREAAIRTLKELQDLHDINETTFNRRKEALQQQMAEFKETKAAPKTGIFLGTDVTNIVKIGA
jgi:SMC interacting uncharacterized protein involved in chromosome segregation